MHGARPPREVPDMYCGDAVLRISHAASGSVLELGAGDALRCCRWNPPPGEDLCPPAGDSEVALGEGTRRAHHVPGLV